MNFISWQFAVFFAATFLLFYVVGFINKKTKKFIPQWAVLLIASLVFYGLNNYIYLFYIIGSSLITYLISFIVQHKMFTEVDGKRKFSPSFIDNHLLRKKYENWLTALAIVINAGTLAVLKYSNFVINIFTTDDIVIKFIVPLGISFYTFSLVGYSVDTCKRKTISEINPLKFLLFVSYFPKVLQGPISSYDSLVENGLFKNHCFNDINYLPHIFRFSIGLIKKVAIANVLNFYVNGIYANISASSGIQLAIGSILYTIQIYCDFSGYMDMALGVSGMLGIELEENFNIPYIAASIGEFWRRWHITLGTWLKKYIYIPLGGNRVKIWRWILNVLIVWLVSGLWHGADLTFVIWGLIHGIALVIEGLPKQIKKQKSNPNEIISQTETKQNIIVKLLRIVLTFAIVNFAWIFFRSANINEAFNFVGNVCQVWKQGSYHVLADTTFNKFNSLLVVAGLIAIILICGAIYKTFKQRIYLTLPWMKKGEIVAIYIGIALFFSLSIMLTLYLNSVGNGGESSFIYFDF